MSVEHNITVEQIRQCLSTCPMDYYMVKILQELQREKSAVHIVSDANTLFIETILHHQGVIDCVSSIISNPAVITKHNNTIEYLNVTKLCGEVKETLHSCASCPINMCKGEIVDRLVKERDINGITVYVGDGSNDYCAVKRLMLDRDFVFARKNYALHQKLQQDGLLKNSHVFLWNDWQELWNLFTNNGIINR